MKKGYQFIVGGLTVAAMAAIAFGVILTAQALAEDPAAAESLIGGWGSVMDSGGAHAAPTERPIGGWGSVIDSGGVNAAPPAVKEIGGWGCVKDSGGPDAQPPAEKETGDRGSAMDSGASPMPSLTRNHGALPPAGQPDQRR